MDEIVGGPSYQQAPGRLRWAAGPVLLAIIGVGVWHLTDSGGGAEAPAVAVLGQTALICQVAGTPREPAPADAPRAAGLVSKGWAGTVHPGVTQHGLYFQRANLTVTREAAQWTRVAVSSPSTARLFYVSSADWAGQEPLRPLVVFDPEAGERAVTFQNCGESQARYFGGIITNAPACVTLAVQPQVAGANKSRVRIPIGKAC
jgi:hypothetical protein